MKKALAPVAALLISVSLLLTGQGLMGNLFPSGRRSSHFRRSLSQPSVLPIFPDLCSAA
jgi:hypothetical protein